MILIRFSDADAKLAALGRLAGRFRFKSIESGEMIVPADALSFLAIEGIVFTVEGPATYEQNGASTPSDADGDSSGFGPSVDALMMRGPKTRKPGPKAWLKSVGKFAGDPVYDSFFDSGKTR